MLHRPLTGGRRLRTQGSMALEAMIAVAIAGLLTAAAASVAANSVRNQAASRVAGVLTQVDQAVRSYVFHRRQQIETCHVARLLVPAAPCPILADGVTVGADLMKPTPPEMVALGLLPAGFAAAVPGVLPGVQVKLHLVPVAVPGGGSANNIEWMVFSEGPLTSSLTFGGADVQMATQVVAQLRSQAAFSTHDQPAVLLGPSGSQVANPRGAEAAVVAAMGGYQSSDIAALLPRAGGEMSGPLTMNNQAILGASMVQASSLKASLGAPSANTGDACTELGQIMGEAGSGRLLSCQAVLGNLQLLPPVATGGQWVPDPVPKSGLALVANTSSHTWIVAASGGTSADPSCQGQYALRASDAADDVELARMEDQSVAAQPGPPLRSASLQLPVAPGRTLRLESVLQCGPGTVQGTFAVRTFKPQ